MFDSGFSTTVVCAIRPRIKSTLLLMSKHLRFLCVKTDRARVEKHLKPSQVWNEVTGQTSAAVSQTANTPRHLQRSKRAETENGRRSAGDAFV